MQALNATLHRLAYLATADYSAAEYHVRRIQNDGQQSLADRVAKLMRQLEDELPYCDLRFGELESILRSDETIEISNEMPVRTRNNLLWKLKRTCLARTLSCIPVRPRVTFILCRVYGAEISEAARMLGINETAARVRLSRAGSKLRNYLEPRCEHLYPDNPCRCDSRLMISLKKGFIGTSYVRSPLTDYRKLSPQRLTELYAKLPILPPERT